MIKAAFLLSADALGSAYGSAVQARLRSQVEITGFVPTGDTSRGACAALQAADVLFSGWGAPRMDEKFLRGVPRLKIIFYAGGSVRYFTTKELWDRGVRITTAQSINAVPVSEYTVSAILLGLKRFWYYARMTREQRTFPKDRPMPGAYQSTVGFVSYGTIARLVRQRLSPYDCRVVVHDPFLTEEQAQRENVVRASLDEVFERADVVSLHAPLLAETTRLITRSHFGRMKPGAVFINTARGEVVDEPAMIEILTQRPDLQAVLDVTSPEPPVAGSPLYSLPNVVLTPHIAGSIGAECSRMGHAMVDEFERYQAGLPLRWEITLPEAELIA